ncbi:lipopolysaccharide biosynthesis protein [Candidatus Woesearchaeota archaeon]|nr:lipopolysaccharide biosynthesis protein [Candidatus Woesearchaeota archaeon]
MSERIQIMKDASIYSLTTYIGEALNFIRGLIVAAMLGPTFFGIWRGLQLIPMYGAYAHLGTINAMERQLPYYRAKQEHEHCLHIRNVTLSSTIIITLLVTFGIIIYSFFASLSREFLLGIQLIAVVVLLQQLWIFFTKYLNTEKKFIIKSTSNLILAVASILFMPGLIFIMGFTGLFIGLILAYLVTLVYIWIHLDFKFSFSLEGLELKTLLQIGFPIIILGLLATLLMSIDRLLILRYSDAKNLGYYSIGIMFLTLIRLGSRVITEVLSPRIYERLGSTEKLESIQGLVFKPTYVSSLLFPFLLGISFFLLPLIITMFLPEYVAGIDALKILIVASFFIPLNPLGMIFFIGISKQHKLIPLAVLLIIFTFLTQYLLLKAGFGILGVAIAVGLTIVVEVTLYLLYMLWHFTKKASDFFRLLLRVYAPFLYFLLVVIVVQSIPLSALGNILATLLQVFIVVILLSPLLYFFNAIIPLKELVGLIKKNDHA